MSQYIEVQGDQKITCPACHSENTCFARKLPMFPAIIFPVDVGVDVDKRDLLIYECLDCEHAFQVDIDREFNQALYTKYYKYYPYGNAEFFLEHYRSPFERTFKAVVASKKLGSLLEIGASDVAQLNIFSDLGFEVTAISPDACEGSKVISAFYEDYRFDKKFDVIVSRFNLEHIVNLDLFMSKVTQDLNEFGYLIVQVPNVSTYKEGNIINFYVHEHSHYFTRQSLEALFKRHGFFIEALHSYNSPSLIIVGCKDKNNTSSSQGSNETTCSVIKSVQNIVKNCAEKGNSVIFYGAGLSLAGLLYGTKGFSIHSNFLVFDDNPVVQGKLLPGTDIIITKPDFTKISVESVIILLLSPIYHSNLIAKIREQGCRNKIYCLNELGLIISGE